MSEKKLRRCVCGEMSIFVPQRCSCGNKEDGCEHCMPGGTCPDCLPPPICPKCQSEDILVSGWDDREALEAHNEITCQKCGHIWDMVFPFDERSVECEMKRRRVHASDSEKKTVH